MRTQKRNRQKMYYSSPIGTEPIYKLDANGHIVYEDIDGELIPVEIGEERTKYGAVKPLRGALAAQLENAIMRAWGSDNTNNYAILVVDKDKYPEITNGTRIWRKSKVSKYEDGSVDGSSADYLVSGVLDEELNEDSYYLTKLDGGSRD